MITSDLNCNASVMTEYNSYFDDFSFSSGRNKLLQNTPITCKLIVKCVVKRTHGMQTVGDSTEEPYVCIIYPFLLMLDLTNE